MLQHGQYRSTHPVMQAGLILDLTLRINVVRGIYAIYLVGGLIDGRLD